MAENQTPLPGTSSAPAATNITQVDGVDPNIFPLPVTEKDLLEQILAQLKKMTMLLRVLAGSEDEVSDDESDDLDN